MMKKVKVLEVISELDRGGAETLIINILNNINRDEFKMDFLCYGSKKFDYESEIKKFECKLWRISIPGQVGMKRHIQEVYNLLKKQKYDVVHVHNLFNCGPVLLAAYLAGVKIRIAHSHNTQYLDERKISFKKKLYYSLSKILLNVFSTKKIACGYDAGRFLFYTKKFIVVNNGISLDKYKFNTKNNNDLRKKFDIPTDKVVIGHVGRFMEQKNHTFLLDVFNKYLDKNPNAILVLAGKGDLEEKIKNKAKKLGISDNIIFLGSVGDMEKYYSLFDYFVFPSLYEGLPFSLIEAQCNGLTCIVSDTITKEVVMSENIYFLSLNDSADMWANFIIKSSKERTENRDEVINRGYDIKKTTELIENIYRRIR